MSDLGESGTEFDKFPKAHKIVEVSLWSNCRIISPKHNRYDLAADWCFGVEMLHQERKLEVGRARHCFPKFFILPRFIPFQIWGEGEGKSLCVGRVRHHHQKDPKTHHQPQKSTSGVKRSVKDPKLPFLPRTFLRSAAYHAVPNVRTK